MDERLQAQLDYLRANYHRRLADIQRRKELAGKVTAMTRSSDGLISVKVGARGELLDLRLGVGVYDRLEPQQLAAAIQELASTATAQAAAQVREIMAPVLPPGGVLPRQSWPGLSRKSVGQ
jgi:hypothetical protein